MSSDQFPAFPHVQPKIFFFAEQRSLLNFGFPKLFYCKYPVYFYPNLKHVFASHIRNNKLFTHCILLVHLSCTHYTQGDITTYFKIQLKCLPDNVRDSLINIKRYSVFTDYWVNQKIKLAKRQAAYIFIMLPDTL